MPLQNRVAPDGSIMAHSARGLLMGNRGGALHGADRTLGTRRWVTRQWISCRLVFKGRQRTIMQPGRYTELFFLDEATALAAGHRPCFECRRQDFLAFADLWGQLRGQATRSRAEDMDRALHVERLTPAGTKRTYSAPLAGLPTGTIVQWDDQAHLVLESGLLPWQFTGYGAPRRPPSEATVDVLTPPSMVAVLAAGYCPALHPSARSRT